MASSNHRMNVELYNIPTSLQTKVSEDPSSIMKHPSTATARSAQISLVCSHHEVYEPCDDSFALVDALLADRNKLLGHRPMFCLEIGCGSGYVITSLALMLSEITSGIHYFATDINPHAVETTKATLHAHGVHADIVLTDIAAALESRLAGMLDLVVINPPYVPTPEEEVGCEGITASWAGGENGRSVIDRILPIVDRLLSEKGWLYMVTLTANNPQQICHIMRERGYASRIVLQRSTEEESLHVIKFWRAESIEMRNRGSNGSDTWFSQWSIFSYRKNTV